MRRAFTLIEMTIVIGVLLLLSALIVPNFVAMKRSRDARDAEAALLRLPAEARDQSRRLKLPVTLRIEGEALVMERTPKDQDPQEIKRLVLVGIRVDSIQQGGETWEPDSWQWVVYPDGSAPTASIELTEDKRARTLIIPADGEARWAAAGETTGDETQWEAGELEQRATL